MVHGKVVIFLVLSTIFAGVNSGQNHLLRPMMYDAYHQITNVSNPKGEDRIYSIVGYICESDTLGYDRKLKEGSKAPPHSHLHSF